MTLIEIFLALICHGGNFKQQFLTAGLHFLCY